MCRPEKNKNRFLSTNVSKTGLDIVLPSESELFDQRTVSVYILSLDIIQQASTPADKNQ